MIRVVLFLLFVGLVALGGAWLAERPGDVAITWLGLRIETSVMVAAAAVALTAALAVVAWSILSLLLRSPRMMARALRDRRRSRASRAISRGLLAIAAGDPQAARKAAAEAERLAGDEPLTLLLTAQAAQLTGDRAGAERAFRTMLKQGDTRLIGLRGLHVEAQRREDADAARDLAEQAANAAPGLPWAGQAALEYRCALGDWGAALAVLDRTQRAGHIDRAAYRRQRAVLLTARALAVADTDTRLAKALAMEATRLAPDLPAAAALAGRLLAEGNELRRAAKVLEAAWRALPHPDLAEVYAHLRSGDSARDRLARVQQLVKVRPNHTEAAFAVARAALDAQDFPTARAALKPLAAAPTQRAALLMAELEEMQHGDVGRAREWMARAMRAPRDPVWTADGYVSEHWMPVSPVTGRLDAFQWAAPAGDFAPEGRLIDHLREAAEAYEAEAARHVPPVALPPGRPPEPVDHAGGGHAGNGQDVEDVSLAPTEPAPVAPGRAAEPAGRGAAPVIPLVHAPDDPGPPEHRPAAAPARRRLFFW
jgi:HemY protein